MGVLCSSSARTFAQYLWEQLPPLPPIEMWSLSRGPIVGQDSPVHCPIWDFGFDQVSSTKPPPYASTVRRLVAEMDKDGFVTTSEPLRAFVREGGSPPFHLGHVKGVARTSVLLSYLLVSRLQPEQVPLSSGHVSLMTSVALRDTQLSNRGSIRKAHCAVTYGWPSCYCPVTSRQRVLRLL